MALLQTPFGLEPLPDEAPGLLALGGDRQGEELARQPCPQGGFSGGSRKSLAFGDPFREGSLAAGPVMQHQVVVVGEHNALSPLLSIAPWMGGYRPFRERSRRPSFTLLGKARGPRSDLSGGLV